MINNNETVEGIKSEIRQLQLKCLLIFDIVEKICREHNIKYSLCGGSDVGAHLYKGFLPWDDDIDIMMTRENYNKFLEVAEDGLPKGYSIINYQNSDYSTTLKISFTKIMDDNTTLVQENGDVMGVFLDVDVYDKVPEGILKHIDLFLCKRLLTINTGKKPGNSINNRFKNLCLDTILSNRRKYLLFFQKVAELLGQYAKNYTYRELFGAYHGYNFEHYTTIEFEGRQVMIVRDYIQYLQIRYNKTDFNEPKEKQVAPHYKYLNFNLPYKKYLAENKNKNSYNPI